MSENEINYQINSMNATQLASYYMSLKAMLRNKLYSIMYNTSCIGSFVSLQWDKEVKNTMMKNLDISYELHKEAYIIVDSMKIVNAFYYKQNGKFIENFIKREETQE